MSAGPLGAQQLPFLKCRASVSPSKFYSKFFTSDMHEAVFLKLHMDFAYGWALIQVNFDPSRKVGGGCSFLSGCSFT